MCTSSRRRSKTMKELEVTLRVSNNRLKQRRDAIGFSQAQLAEAVGISLCHYASFENLTSSPLSKKTGDWRKSVLKLAAFHCVDPKELFPPGVVNIKKPRSVRKLNAVEVIEFLHGRGPKNPELVEESQHSALAREEIKTSLKAGLTVREEKVLRLRFGLDDSEPHTLAQVADIIGVSSERVRGIENKALQRLRHPSNSRRLKEFSHSTLVGG